MRPYSPENIVALATPPGLGALAIIRFSGADLSSIYKRFSHKRPVDRRAVFSKIYHPKNNNILDEAIIIYFKSPNSFTGEDVIEITCHGGLTVPRSIIAAAMDCGIRAADPGEFSFRSFLNGKMDLIQAEAVSSLIGSKSKFSANVSLNHLAGHVSCILTKIKDNALNMLSVIENELDFSEDELDLTSFKDIRKMAVNIRKDINSILNNSTFGFEAFSGIRVVFIGKPNSGKSSLFNSILGVDRAIVSNIPGTTRDTVESIIELESVPVCLVDTAGVWESDDFLDNLSIQKTLSELNNANICVLIDDVDPFILLKSNFSKYLKKHCVFVKTKCDLNNSFKTTDNNVFDISVKNGSGINNLLTYLSTYIIKNVNTPEVIDHVLITHRQRNLLKDSLLAINDVIQQIEAFVSADVLASGLRGFVVILREVLGEIPNDDVLNNIFSKFCIGK